MNEGSRDLGQSTIDNHQSSIPKAPVNRQSSIFNLKFLYLFQRDPVVGVDVDARRDQEGFAGDVGGAHVGAVFQEGAGGGKRVGSARADGEDSLFGRDQVAGAGDQERRRLVGDDQ